MVVNAYRVQHRRSTEQAGKLLLLVEQLHARSPDSLSCVGEPVGDLKIGQTSVFTQGLLVLRRWVRVVKVLIEPVF